MPSQPSTATIVLTTVCRLQMDWLQTGEPPLKLRSTLEALVQTLFRAGVGGAGRQEDIRLAADCWATYIADHRREIPPTSPGPERQTALLIELGSCWLDPALPESVQRLGVYLQRLAGHARPHTRV